jgi:hypothetical protein
MSNYLAIATVTAAISQLLEEVRTEVQGTRITVRPPDVANAEAPPANRLNIFLYQVAPNAAYRNDDLPARDARGRLAASPRLALNLHYLLTAYAADNDDLVAQQILASAMRIMNENPVLSRDIIRDAVSARQNLQMSDLVDQVESIKLTLQPMNLEELSKLWSSFFQTNYRISVAYQATMVLLESRLQPRPALPVRERLLYTLPFRRPVIERVEPQVIERNAGAKVTITGRNLKAAGVRINFDDISMVPNPDDVSDTRISAEVPLSLAAGIKQVQVVHPAMLGLPATEHRGYESNTAAFILSPRITSPQPLTAKPGGSLTIAFEPPVTPRQKVVVLLGDATIPVPPRAEGSAPVGNVTIKVPDDFAEGKFLLRLRVSGAESSLQTDDLANPKYVGPAVEVKKA